METIGSVPSAECMYEKSFDIYAWIKLVLVAVGVLLIEMV